MCHRKVVRGDELMMKKFYSCTYEYSSHNLECYFKYANSVVFTRKIVPTAMFTEEMNNKIGTIVEIISECEMPDFFGASETARFCRKENIVIQGIITFFSGSAITSYDCCESNVNDKGFDYEKNNVYLKVDGVEYTNDLEILLKKLEETPDITATLLDRWRKALYLKNSGDFDLFYDEINLNLFHVIELLAEESAQNFKSKLTDKINIFLNNYYDNCYLTEVDPVIQNVRKNVENLLFKDTFSLSAKIKHFLNCNDLLNANVSAFIDDLIKTRNAIAHGRKIFQKNFMYPLSPFFNLTKNSFEITDVLISLTAVMISKYIGINHWLDEWKKIEEILPPSKFVINDFFDHKLSKEIINSDSLVNGNKYNITWQSLFEFYVKNPKLEVKRNIEKVVKDEFLNVVLNEDNASVIFNISIIFADSDDIDIKFKAVSNVKEIISKRWYDWLNFKDILAYLEFHSVQVQWYRQFLESKEYMTGKI